jgi:hypothetical protein
VDITGESIKSRPACFFVNFIEMFFLNCLLMVILILMFDYLLDSLYPWHEHYHDNIFPDFTENDNDHAFEFFSDCEIVIYQFFFYGSKEQKVSRSKIHVVDRMKQSYSSRYLDTYLELLWIMGRYILEVDHTSFQCPPIAMRSDVDNSIWYNDIISECCIIYVPFGDITEIVNFIKWLENVNEVFSFVCQFVISLFQAAHLEIRFILTHEDRINKAIKKEQIKSNQIKSRFIISNKVNWSQLSVYVRELLEADLKRIFFQPSRRQKSSGKPNEDKTSSVPIDREASANKLF